MDILNSLTRGIKFTELVALVVLLGVNFLIIPDKKKYKLLKIKTSLIISLYIFIVIFEVLSSYYYVFSLKIKLSMNLFLLIFLGFQVVQIVKALKMRKDKILGVVFVFTISLRVMLFTFFEKESYLSVLLSFLSFIFAYFFIVSFLISSLNKKKSKYNIFAYW